MLSLLIDPSASTNATLAHIAQQLPSLSWTSPISTFIHSFVLSDPYATSHITLEDVASHRSGFPRHDSSYGGPGYETKEKLASRLRYLPLTAEPRTRFQYSNMMYMLLSHVIETLTGAYLGNLMRAWIWTPLNMSNTFFNLTDALRFGNSSYDVKLAVPYFWDSVENATIREEYFSSNITSGASNTISNVLDYVLYLRAMTDQVAPISQAQHAELRKPRSFAQPEDQPHSSAQLYALGWFVSQYRGQTIVYHGGALGGFRTQMLYMPWRKWGFVAMGNSAGATDAFEVLQYRLLDDLLQTPEDERIDWQAKADARSEEEDSDLVTGRKRLYPNAPTPKLPLTLPLENYEGLYSHPAYNLLNLTLAKPSARLPLSDCPKLVLHADARYKTFPVLFDFEHVSGEFFLLYTSQSFTEEDFVPSGVTSAEFRLNESGEVSEVGIALEPEMKGERIWFRRTL